MAEDFYPEDVLDKPYDWGLMKRLLEYAKPYWPIIALCVVLIMFSAGFDASLPYLTRLAIDRHIACASLKITIPDESLYRRIRETYRKLLTPVSNTELLIDAAATNKLISADLKLVRDRGFLNDTRLYVMSKADYSAADWNEVGSICRKHAFSGFEGAFYVSVEKLTRLPAADLLVIRGKDIAGIKTLGLIFLSVLILNFVVTYAQIYLMQFASQRTLFDLRLSLFDRIQRLPLSFLDKSPVGRLVTRTTNDFDTVNEMLSSVLVNVVKDFLMLFAIAAVMLYASWKLALAVFALMPAIIYITFLFKRKARAAYRKIRVKLARMNASFAEFITGISVIRSFCQEGRIDGKFSEINHDVFLWRKKQIMIFAIFTPAMWVLSFSAVAVVVWYGGGQVVQNLISLGVLVMFLSYVEMFFRPIHDLAEKFNIVQAAMASSERIFQLMDREEEPKVAAPPEVSAPKNMGVEFKNVWFAYNDDNWVLKDVSFKVRPGETVAIVGATGAGKTTMASLLSRLYTLQKGEILIDGANIAALSLENLRKMIGIVQQDVFLFSTTVGGNVRLNDAAIDDAAIKRSVRIARAERLVSRLPKGLEEPVVERGATLSAGEKQLLAFARVLAFDRKILVLDEATSNIDPETESLIQEALIDLTKGRTSLIIAHRLSTIEHADRIVVLHKGRLREEGTHEELLEKRGIYYDLYRLQYV
ncbi:MAG: ABC transporter ATP-binding protein [Candidatus Coatesbacteria bacterium]|nr:ABC transporter ATP-binding protein [Candidatus Coatesbacteria bacterium]